MSEWNPDLYLKFKNERTQPALDRVNRIRHLPPDKAADLRCGPGSSTAVLRDAFPSAQLIEIDSSELMIRQAREKHPELTFRHDDARNLDGGVLLHFRRFIFTAVK